jgi:hypothetical protein
MKKSRDAISGQKKTIGKCMIFSATSALHLSSRKEINITGK